MSHPLLSIEEVYEFDGELSKWVSPYSKIIPNLLPPHMDGLAFIQLRFVDISC